MYAGQKLTSKRIAEAKKKFDGSAKSRQKAADSKKLYYYAKLIQKNTGKGEQN